MTKLIVLVACLMGLNVATSLHLNLMSKEWTLFKEKFHKSFSNADEEKSRHGIFVENMKNIEKHNQLFEEGKVSYKMGVNEFTDKTFEEFFAVKGGLRPSINKKPNQIKHLTLADDKPTNGSNTTIPDAIDWREKGAVTPVKDQQRCGSCWAFSAVGAIEGQHFIKNGELVGLSEQQLVDCSWLEGNFGCFGGLMTHAFDYVIKYGISAEQYYPYVGFNFICRYLSFFQSASVSSYEELPDGDEEELKKRIATVGPMSIAFDVEKSFQNYEGGIYYEENCGPDGLNHGMLAVGYGTTEAGEDYWLVKNSWGTNWGEEGYVRIARNRGNTCGIASMSSYPVLE